MVWCKILRIEDSIYDNNDSKIVYFDYLGRERMTIVSQKVLNYLDIYSIDNYSEIFVVKTFIDGNKKKEVKEAFVIKKVR